MQQHTGTEYKTSLPWALNIILKDFAFFASPVYNMELTLILLLEQVSVKRIMYHGFDVKINALDTGGRNKPINLKRKNVGA